MQHMDEAEFETPLLTLPDSPHPHTKNYMLTSESVMQPRSGPELQVV